MVQIQTRMTFISKLGQFCAWLLLISLIIGSALCEENQLALKKLETPENSSTISDLKPVSLRRRSPLPQATQCPPGQGLNKKKKCAKCGRKQEVVKNRCVKKCKNNQTRNAQGKCVNKAN
ncbi:hypothetical protein PGT21_031342 [Puccinia graminis f. sp. tritici]|uniref:MYND-type domain-containing protein n=2 Tax=Puccinia graminis f. sp. tritici TaxID=56615 RepID=A0A5B0MZF9_PUCGR|nr:hypothetical protein PGT21_031342 [Puccinia graminis f. sp. tritici]